MKINAKVTYTAEPDEIALALAKTSPEQFHTVWIKFNEYTDEEILKKLAKQLSSKYGANAKTVLKKLVNLINFYEIAEENSNEDGL